DADLYVNAKYFGAIFASAESPEFAARLAATQRPFAARCLKDKAPAAIGWKTIPSWYVIGDADKVIPPDILNKFATCEVESLPRSGWRPSEHDRASQSDGGGDRRCGKYRCPLSARRRQMVGSASGG